MRPALHARARAIRQFAAAGFPALSAPAVLLFGDSLTAHEHQNININNTISRAVTTGRMTQSATNVAISTNLIGTPEVQFVNLTDSSMEVNGRNNYPDGAGGSNGLSVHTVTSDPIATRAWSFNPTTSGSATAALGNGTIINLTRKSHRGVAHNTSALFGGGVHIVGNLGYPGAKSTDMVNALAYAKLILQQFTNPMAFVKLGTNDIKGSVTPNNAFAGIKVILDGLTGIDGNGGNAVVAFGSVPMLGSSFTGYATVNPQSIGTCSAPGSPSVLAPDSTMYTVGGVSQHTLNYQLWQYALAHPSKLLFVDETTDSYDTTNHCMYDATHLDSTSSAHTNDGTHWLTNSALLQAQRRHDALVAAGVTFPSAVPSSSSDSSTFNGHSRLANHGPYSGDATKTTGFLGTTSTGTQPNTWTCGATGSNVTSVFSIEVGDSKGDWVKAVLTPTAANATVSFYPWTNGGVTIGTLGLTSADNSELQFACEVKWDTARAAGLALVQAVMQTNSAGGWGYTTSGEETETPALGGLPDNVSGRVLTTGWMQNSSASITGVIPLLTVKFGAITGTPVTVWVRRAVINKY